MERGNPAGAVEESVRWHIFTNLKADEPFVEGKDVTTTDPKVLCDDVKSPTWSRRPPVPFCQTNLEGITAARLIWKGGGYAHTEYEGSVSRDSLCARNERLGASPRQLHPQKDLLALSRYVGAVKESRLPRFTVHGRRRESSGHGRQSDLKGIVVEAFALWRWEESRSGGAAGFDNPRHCLTDFDGGGGHVG